MIREAAIVSPSYTTRIGEWNFQFRSGVNVLAGANGCGKSSLLEAIQQEVTNRDQKVARLVRDESIPVYYYFGEEATGKKPNGSDMDLTTIKQSHGQRLTTYLAGVQNLRTEATILLDEPELALDYLAIEALCRSMAERPNIQFIVSSHHPLLFTFKEVNIINMDREDEKYAQNVLKRLRQRISKI